MWWLLLAVGLYLRWRVLGLPRAHALARPTAFALSFFGLSYSKTARDVFVTQPVIPEQHRHIRTFTGQPVIALVANRDNKHYLHPTHARTHARCAQGPGRPASRKP